MSFAFDWSSVEQKKFSSYTKTLLTDALNMGQKPPVIADKITVSDLSLGTQTPELEILEIGDLGLERFQGIFKIKYSGDASITLSTKVQANPLSIYSTIYHNDLTNNFAMPDFLLADATFPIPLILSLSEIRLSGIIIMVFSKKNGLTLVFKNDPLESISVSSSFNHLTVLAKFLQVQIENQIRDLFREELPTILHKLSHRYTTANGGLMAVQLHNQLRSSARSPLDTIQPSGAASGFEPVNTDEPPLSPSNMLKLQMLFASRHTLSVFTPAISDVVYRSTMDKYQNKSELFFKLKDLNMNRKHLAGDNYHQMEQYMKQIAGVQTKVYYRSVHEKPRRRVVRLNRRGAPAAEKVSAVAEEILADHLTDASDGARAAAAEKPVGSAEEAGIEVCKVRTQQASRSAMRKPRHSSNYIRSPKFAYAYGAAAESEVPAFEMLDGERKPAAEFSLGESDVKAELASEAGAEGEAEAEAEARAEVEAGRKAEPKAEVKSERKAEPKHSQKSEQKSDRNSEQKPERDFPSFQPPSPTHMSAKLESLLPAALERPSSTEYLSASPKRSPMPSPEHGIFNFGSLVGYRKPDMLKMGHGHSNSGTRIQFASTWGENKFDRRHIIDFFQSNVNDAPPPYQG